MTTIIPSAAAMRQKAESVDNAANAAITNEVVLLIEKAANSGLTTATLERLLPPPVKEALTLEGYTVMSWDGQRDGQFTKISW